MRGRMCLVTGASQGIGKETAVGLARQGATVVLLCRDRARGEAAVQDVQARGNGGEVSLLLADLSSMREVRRVAQEFRERYSRLDVLVNNVGGIYMERRLSAEGNEMTLATNHLSAFLLTGLLLELVVASPQGRIVNVSSSLHRLARLDLQDLQNERRYGGLKAYCRSKLCNALFTHELARRLKETRATANFLHPGAVASGFGRNNAGFFGWLVRAVAPFHLTPEQGARTLIHLASAPEVARVSGGYFEDCKQRRPSSSSSDDALARQLWEHSARLTGLT
ncbi:SDR family oxidoreductase [Melittangium boletus]|uniref:Short-chain dehydrogenase n=1 Tax=Melittangium boletus DSM 14713 TaxID=1294270 RepID=A0A250I6X4_9BACT|nr:SDR family oxidoreductase [Melittangium boletus]ATB27515.1 short-chain dehydrogenase [Melittangium boletus DSM 14713]